MGKIDLTTWNEEGNAEKWREDFATLWNQYLEKSGEQNEWIIAPTKDKTTTIFQPYICEQVRWSEKEYKPTKETTADKSSDILIWSR